MISQHRRLYSIISFQCLCFRFVCLSHLDVARFNLSCFHVVVSFVFDIVCVYALMCQQAFSVLGMLYKMRSVFIYTNLGWNNIYNTMVSARRLKVSIKSQMSGLIFNLAFYIIYYLHLVTTAPKCDSNCQFIIYMSLMIRVGIYRVAQKRKRVEI